MAFSETRGTGQVRIARFDSPPDMAGYWSWVGTEILEIPEDEPNLVSDIALEFGSRGRGHQPLRSAANRRTLRDLRKNWEEHDYSEVLTGAFYDILRRLYADALPRAQKALKKRGRWCSTATATSCTTR